jgi:prolyl oligopeptidase
VSIGSLLPDPIVEILHGAEVVDPYRWLEDGSSVETREWLRHQQHILNTFFSDRSGLELLRCRVDELLNTPVVDQPLSMQNRLFYRRRKKDQEQPCIYFQDLRSHEERLLVDPSGEGPYTSVRIHRVSCDASLLAFEVKRGGSDTRQIRIMSVNDQSIFPETVALGYAGSVVFATDNGGFYYCPELGNNAEDHVIRYHHFGRPTRLDHEIFRLARTSANRLVLTADNVHLGVACGEERDEELVTDFYVATHSSRPQWERIFTSKRSPFVPILKNGRIFVFSCEEAANGQIVECRRDGSVIGIVVPEQETRLHHFSITTMHIFATYAIGHETVIQRWTLFGKCEGLIQTPESGTIQLLPNLGDGDDLHYTFQSFTVPLAIFRYSPRTASSCIWSKLDLTFDSDRYEVHQFVYPSKDGTDVPLSLVMSRECRTKVDYPVVMTAYGGFGTAMTPQFSALVAVLLELGVIFALPNIRGGSEFGKQWHEAARGRNRQVAIDDFLSAARWLCDNRVTIPRKLGIFGGSNSGLLVAAAMTQAPDLFGAVLCIAPILDMVRYERFGQACKWRREYGSVSNPDDFRALYAYSPYHRIQENVDYPATYFVSGDKDDRCDPAHVRKMAAYLQNRPAQTKPILVDYNPERGHSPVLPLSVRIDALARRIAFLCKELGISSFSGDTI